MPRECAKTQRCGRLNWIKTGGKIREITLPEFIGILMERAMGFEPLVEHTDSNGKKIDKNLYQKNTSGLVPKLIGLLLM